MNICLMQSVIQTQMLVFLSIIHKHKIKHKMYLIYLDLMQEFYQKDFFLYITSIKQSFCM